MLVRTANRFYGETKWVDDAFGFGSDDEHRIFGWIWVTWALIIDEVVATDALRMRVQKKILVLMHCFF